MKTLTNWRHGTEAPRHAGKSTGTLSEAVGGLGQRTWSGHLTLSAPGYSTMGSVHRLAALLSIPLLVALNACAQPCASCRATTDLQTGSLFSSSVLTAPGLFTGGIEGPACGADGMLYVVNFDHQGTIGRVTPQGEVKLFVELPAGSVGNGIRFTSGGDMLVADYRRHNVLRVHMGTRQVTVLVHEPRMHQPNDLAIDGQDRVYASDPDWSSDTGQLWRIDPDGSTTLLEEDMGTTNGIEVGPGDAALYVGESAQRRVWAYDLEPDGTISSKRLLIHFPDHGLDGMRCDIDGNLYVTRYGKGVVAQISPTGEVLREIELQGDNPSNIAFGGADGRTCYVTVADRRHVETFRVERPGRSWWLSHHGATGVAPRSWGDVKRGG